MDDDDDDDDSTNNTRKRRDSYAVERRFYDHPDLATRIRQQYNLIIPKLIVGDKDGKQPYPVVCWIMNDLTQEGSAGSGSGGYPIEVSALSYQQAKIALTWLAKFHAIHWNDDYDTVLWRKQSILHDRGGFWTTTTTIIIIFNIISMEISNN